MKEIKEETQSVKKIQYYCDMCHAFSTTSCCMCGKDLCNNCVTHEDYEEGDGRGNCYCQKCWDLGKDYRDKIELLEKEIEKLRKEWFDKCKS